MMKLALGAIGVIILLLITTNIGGYYHDRQNRQFCKNVNGVITKLEDGSYRCTAETSAGSHITLTWSWQ